MGLQVSIKLRLVFEPLTAVCFKTNVTLYFQMDSTVSQISEPHVCDAYYRPLLSNFLKISRSEDDENRKGGQEEGDVEVEVNEVDEKQ